jgi:hypothetical protein
MLARLGTPVRREEAGMATVFHGTRRRYVDHMRLAAGICSG